MKSLHGLLILASLNAPALSQEFVPVIYAGSVSTVVSPFTTGPFTAVAPGDAFRMEFDACSSGIPGSPAVTTDFYRVAPSTILVTIGSASDTSFPSFFESTLVVRNTPGSPDAFDLLNVLLMNSSSMVRSRLLDSNESLLDTAELLRLVGTYPASVFDSIEFEITEINGPGSILIDVQQFDLVETNIGLGFCGPAVPNTSGSPGVLQAIGSRDVVVNDVTLSASGLPGTVAGLFLTSMSPGFVAMPSGSLGNLCLAGDIGRYFGPTQFQFSDFLGRLERPIDLSMTPTPNGPVSIMSGQTWYFQVWYRDFIPGFGPTSNFTNGTEVTFQ